METILTLIAVLAIVALVLFLAIYQRMIAHSQALMRVHNPSRKKSPYE